MYEECDEKFLLATTLLTEHLSRDISPAILRVFIQIPKAFAGKVKSLGDGLWSLDTSKDDFKKIISLRSGSYWCKLSDCQTRLICTCGGKTCATESSIRQYASARSALNSGFGDSTEYITTCRFIDMIQKYRCLRCYTKIMAHTEVELLSYRKY